MSVPLKAPRYLSEAECEALRPFLVRDGKVYRDRHSGLFYTADEAGTFHGPHATKRAALEQYQAIVDSLTNGDEGW